MSKKMSNVKPDTKTVMQMIPAMRKTMSAIKLIVIRFLRSLREPMDIGSWQSHSEIASVVLLSRNDIHRRNQILWEIAVIGLLLLIAPGKLWALKSCADTYCHGNFATPGGSGYNAIPYWDMPNSGKCGTCHGAGKYGEYDTIVGSAPKGGSHYVHTSTVSTTGYNYSCKLCHDLTTNWAETLSSVKLSTSVHVFDYATDIKFSTDTRTSGGLYGLASSSQIAPPRGSGYATQGCTKLYCHSAGYNYTVTWASPTWGTASSGKCGTCHRAGEFEVPYGTAPTGWLRHYKHVSTTTYSFDCQLCHYKTVDATKIISRSTHVNYGIDIVFSTDDTRTTGGKYKGSTWYTVTPPSSSYATNYSTTSCANLYCHSTATGTATIEYKTVYSTETLPADCSGCHGKPETVLGSTTTLTTAHSKHIDSQGGRYGYKCSRCHEQTTKPESVTEILYSSHHVNYVKTVDFSTYNPNGSYLTDYKCSNLYCHGRITAQYLISMATPVWTQPTSAKCGTCHAVTTKYAYDKTDLKQSTAPVGWKHYTHVSSMTYDYACRLCHEGTVNWSGGIVYTTAHVNNLTDIKFSTDSRTSGGQYNGQTGLYSVAPSSALANKSCNNLYCHSTASGTYKMVYSSDTVTCSSCHGTWAIYPSSTNLTQAHSDHVDSGGTRYNLSCEQCHYATVISTWSIRNKTLHVDSVKKVSFTATWSGNFDNLRCSNTYCHGNFPGSGYITNIATWTVAGTGKCGTCHATAQYAYNKTDVKQSTAPAGWKHYKHVSTTTYNYPCKVCHDKTVDAAGNIVNYSTHVVNKKVDVKFATSTYSNIVFTTTTYRGYGGSNYYSGAVTGTYNNAVCSNTYCHSNANPYGGTFVYRGVYSTETITCLSCHSGAGSGGSANLSIAHATHTQSSWYGYKCDKCHYDTVAQDSTSTIKTPGGYLAHISTSSIPSTRNVRFAMHPDTGTYVTSAKQCLNTYCHSSGTSTWNKGSPTSSVLWTATGTVKCSSCHGFIVAGSTVGPSYNLSTGRKPNAHIKHTSAPWNYSCDICHRETVTSAYTINFATHHVDGIYTATPTATYSFNYIQRSTPSASTCLSISCHGGNYALWSDTVPVSCLDCHGASSDIDDFAVGLATNNFKSSISTGQWYASGHGLSTSSFYYMSGNPGAGFGSTCTYCHSNEISHRDLTNPFRLVNSTFTSGATLEQRNGVCLVCHKTDDPGYAPTGYPLKDGTKDVSENHYGAKHSTSTRGGAFCWDCHDPHGDREGTTGNIYMVHTTSVTRFSDGNYGYWGSTTTSPSAQRYATFTSTTPGTTGFYASSTTAANIPNLCNTCHIDTKFYRYNYGENHSIDARCTSCHAHSKKFGATCIQCHDAPPYVTAAPVNDTHRNHYSWSASTPTAYGGTEWALNKSSGSIYIFNCGICHNASHGASSAKSTFTVQIVFDTTTFPLNVYSTYTYAGTSWSTHTYSSSGQGYRYNNSGQCQNNYCHGTFVSTTTSNNTIGISSTPVWGGAMPTDAGTKCATACHNISTETASGRSHRIHRSSYGFTCDWCHYDTALSTYSINLSSYHVNGKVDWDFDTNKSTWILASSKYKGLPESSTATPGAYSGNNCTNFYCHSNAAPILGTLAYSSATWGTDLTCSTGCHSGVGTGGGTNLSAAHKAHISTSPASDAYGYSCYRCHKETVKVESNIEINYSSHHVNGNKTIVFSTHNANASYVKSSTQCANTYCHSSGTSTWNKGSPTSSVLWTATGTVKCSSCHGFLVAGSTVGPSYILSTGRKPNAHIKHTSAPWNYSCDICHRETVTSAYTIRFATHHVDGIYTATPTATYSFNYIQRSTPSASTCLSISCHGGNYALWSDTVPVSCLDCHGASSDVDDFVVGLATNNFKSSISTGQWYASGHGLSASSFYYMSGNPGAGFGSTCTYCHSNEISHRDLTNPFRLVNSTFTSGATLEQRNGVCLVCHKTGDTGYAPTGYPLKDGTKDVSENHYGAKHSTSTRGGAFCWDCHDPHGDREGTTDNIYMVHTTSVTRFSDGNYGYWGSTTTPAAQRYTVFTSTTPGTTGFYASSTTAANIPNLCNTCHIDTKFYRYNYGENHSIDARCTSCHAHSKKFGATCIQCHPAPSPPTYGAHRKHYDWAASTLTAYSGSDWTTNQSSGLIYIYNCGICHSASHGASSDKSTFTVQIVFSTTAFPVNYQSTYTYVGSWSTYTYATSGQSYKYNPTGQCRNNYCHGTFVSTTTSNNTIGISSVPVWGGAMPTDAGTKCATACHNISTVTTSGQSHRIHFSSQGYTCTMCHFDTASSSYTVRFTSRHVSGWVEIDFNETEPSGRIFSTSTYANVTYAIRRTTEGYTGKFCTNIYCHSTVQGSSITTVSNPPTYRSVSWSSGTLSCEACHTTSSTTATTANFTGSHYAHIKSTFAYTCDKCHPYTNPRDPGSNRTQHSDKLIQVTTGNYAVNHSSAPQTPEYGRCSNVSCHGQDVNFQWGTNISTDCKRCHLTTAADVDDYVFKNGIMASISSSSFYSSKHSTQPCVNSGCHSKDVPHISTNPFRLQYVAYSTTTELGCLGVCHSGTSYVRHSSYTTKGDTTKNWGQGVNNPPNDFKCIDCHDPHRDIGESGSTNTAMLQRIIARGGSSTDTYKSGVPNFNVGLGTKTIDIPVLGKATDYIYNPTYSVGQDTQTTKICQTCHQANKYYTIKWSSSSQHKGSETGGKCTGCHKHKEGFSGAGCSAGPTDCHGNPTADTYWPDGTGNYNDAGAHLKHVKAIANYNVDCSTYGDNQKNVCKFCHVVDPGVTNHNAPYGTVNLEIFKNIAGAQETVATSSVAWYVKASSTCQKSDCHAEKETPNWYNPPAPSCGETTGSCHPGTNKSPNTLAHYAHVSTYSYTCTQCHTDNYLVTPSSYAHTNAKVDMWWSSGTPVQISTIAFYDKYKKGTSTTGFSPSWLIATSTFGPCWNVYCHRPSTQTFIWWSQTWISTGLAGTARCNMCHELPPRYTTSFTHYGDHTMGSTGTVNASTQVFSLGQNAGLTVGGYNFGCAKCHPDPTVSISKHARGIAYRVGTSTMTANLTFDASVDPKNPNVVWSTGNVTSLDNRGFWFTNTRCSSTFCHGGTTLPSGMRTGQYVTTQGTPTWNTDLAETGDSACGACHARRQATSGSHTKHVSSYTYAYNCELCHYDSAMSTYTVRYSSHHVDGKASWNFNETDVRIWSTSTYKGSPAGSTGTFVNYGDTVLVSSCTNLYCHSKGRRDQSAFGTPNRVPRWGGNISTGTPASTCGGCHGGREDFTVLTSTHMIHTSTNTLSGKRQYDYTCETCHKDVVIGTGTIRSPGGYTLHVSSIANVSFSTTTVIGYNRTLPAHLNATYNRDDKKCRYTYCHSDGTAVKTGSLGQWATPQWMP